MVVFFASTFLVNERGFVWLTGLLDISGEDNSVVRKVCGYKWDEHGSVPCRHTQFDPHHTVANPVPILQVLGTQFL
jgi:hypothetical protein